VSLLPIAANSRTPGQAAAGAVAAVLANGAGLGARPLSPAILAFALHLPGGGFTVLTGASGAGKSTLLRVLAGALGPMAPP